MRSFFMAGDRRTVGKHGELLYSSSEQTQVAEPTSSPLRGKKASRGLTAVGQPSVS